MTIALPGKEIYEQDADDSSILGVEKTVETSGGVCKYLGVKAHAALTALTTYSVAYSATQASNPTTAAIADSGTTYKIIGIPPVAIASGKYGWVQTEGPVDNVICASDAFTAGHGIKVLDAAAVVDTDGAYAYLTTEWAIACQTGTLTDVDIYMVGGRVLTTT